MSAEDDKRVHEALMTCCNAAARQPDRKLALEQMDGRWFASIERPSGRTVVRGNRSLEADGAYPEGALIALARELSK